MTKLHLMVTQWFVQWTQLNVLHLWATKSTVQVYIAPTVVGRRVVLQRKPFAFEIIFCLANAGFFTFSSKTRSEAKQSVKSIVFGNVH